MNKILNIWLDEDARKKRPRIFQPERYDDCKYYLYCFHGLADQFVLCPTGKPLGITKNKIP